MESVKHFDARIQCTTARLVGVDAKAVYSRFTRWKLTSHGFGGSDDGWNGAAVGSKTATLAADRIDSRDRSRSQLLFQKEVASDRRGFTRIVASRNPESDMRAPSSTSFRRLTIDERRREKVILFLGTAWILPSY